MPELPAAEANRRRVEAGALHRTIAAISVDDPGPMTMPTPAEQKRLIGTQFTQARRYGKYVFLGSATGPWLVISLGMTGIIQTYDETEGAPKHAKLTVTFEGDRRLAYICPRKFGDAYVAESVEAFVAEHKLGPDALEIGKAEFAERVGPSKSAIKTVLMDQSRLAGIGNLWSDETLYRVGLSPEIPANALGDNRLGDIHAAAQEILQAAVDTPDAPKSLPDDWLVHHRKPGAPCPRCGGTIKKKSIGGRSAYFCPDHQEGA
ncbi:Fpg/Nei family DNA glycosylase [Pseudoroseicyclus tamaricis]|uniref:Fpg/Nei family DNA glycosylase n=1 Tax=Pseudoroseicyclus tamaricis TaxID=2705421 RepID=A0A6B2JU81_9RHOB|nr:Fpg/Nei family DNA glycosylase [Pseudoroseicyclus tamaricis]NDU99733.1 Fpg/Nei family DNA glycosylase [Pseudoroseicyclus tamaricis]